MWVTRHTPRTLGGSLQRIFFMLTASLMAAVFACMVLSGTDAYADAQWSGSNIVNDGQTYRVSASPPRLPGTTGAYQWIDTSQSQHKAHVLYFASSPDNKVVSQAQLVVYDHPGYTNATQAVSISVQPNLDAAMWTGGELSYKDNPYRVTASPPRLPGTTGAYQWIDTSVSPNRAYVLYFSGDNPQAATSAQLRIYDHPGYGNPSSITTIQVQRDLTVDAQGQNTSDSDGPIPRTTCDGSVTGGIGWIVCPVSNWLADGVDGVYRMLESFLKVDTLSDKNSGIYQIWQIVLSIANVCFVIAFLVIIYSQVTSIGLSNHAIKAMVPRLIITAILVNLSYIICALAVDISNLLGFSVQSILVSVREANATSAYVDTWSVLTGAILGGAGAIAGLGFAAAAGGSGISLGFLILAALIPAALAVLVAFVILAARQALIMVFVIVSPLAFVAYILPSTEKYFEKWRKAFVTLLVFFPLFSLLFGATQLLGSIIISSQQPPDGQLHIVIMGLAIQVVPLVITPLLIRFSTGLLGTIAQFANNSKRGLADRTKNWALENADYHKKNKLAKTAYHARPGFRRNLLDARGFGRLGLAMDQNKRTRDLANKESDALLSNRAERNWERRHDDPTGTSGDPTARFGQRRRYNRLRTQRHLAHDYHKQAETYKSAIEAEGDREWNEHLQGASGNYARLRQLRTQALTDKSVAERYDKAMTNADTRSFESNLLAGKVSGGVDYGHLRDIQVQSDVDAAHAKFASDQVASMGKVAFKRDFVGSGAEAKALRTASYEMFANEQEASVVDEVLKQRGDARWQRISKSDDSLRNLRLEALDAAKSASDNTEQWNTLIENIQAQGAQALDQFTQLDATGNMTQSTVVGRSLAGKVQQSVRNVSAEKDAQARAQYVQQSELLKAYNTDTALAERAGGIDPLGATKIRAKAQEGMTKLHMENVQARTSMYSNDGANVDELLKVAQNMTMPDGTAANEIDQHAALQHVLTSIGNNWSAQKILDWADSQGMYYDENSKQYYAVEDYAQYLRDKESNPSAAKPTELDASEVSRRRDLLQVVKGAYQSGPLRVDYASATMMERMNRGLSSLVTKDGKLASNDSFSKNGIIADAKMGKFDAERITTSDPDVLSRMIQIFREKENRDQLNKAQKRGILEQIYTAQTSPQTRHRIKNRERSLMNTVAAYLEVEDGIDLSSTQRQALESSYDIPSDVTTNDPQYGVRVSANPSSPMYYANRRTRQTSFMAPNTYDVTRQDDIGPSGIGSYARGANPDLARLEEDSD